MRFLKYGKRIFSTILVICMIIGMMPISAFAVEMDQVQELDAVNHDIEVLADTSVNDLPEPMMSDYYQLISAPQVTTNGSWYYDYNGNKLLDDDTNTFAWMALDQEPGRYMQVDLGSIQKIDTVSVSSPNGTDDYCVGAKVQVSVDGANWKDIGEHTGSKETVVTDTYGVNEEIRYIRVYIVNEKKPYWWQLAEISWTPSIADGTYIIVNDTDKAMTNIRVENPTGFKQQAVTIYNDMACPLDSIYEWTFAKQSNGTYYITDCNGKYLNINGKNNISVSDLPQEITVSDKNESGKVQLSYGDISVNYFASNGQIYSGWDKGEESNNLQSLYKKVETDSLNTFDLYNVILEASSYNNSNGCYGMTEYAELQQKITDSIEVYKNAYVVEPGEDYQESIDAQTEALNMAIANLLKSINYIEVPIQILDFRADGVMFEYKPDNVTKQNLYELLVDPTDEEYRLVYDNEIVPMPGENVAGKNGNTRRIGLVEDYLVNGAPVYKEETVDYVAKIIANGIWGDGFVTGVSNRNTAIPNKLEELKTYYITETNTNTKLGTWNETLLKTSTGVNGGSLTWNKVETCYDLAYYVLNNMWRSVERADGDYIYNKVVPERTTMRLVQGEDGLYTLDSSKAITYSDSYIYNSDLDSNNNAGVKFTPINSLGYESENMFGDTTDRSPNVYVNASGVNFHFTLNMRGAFVYNADDDLYFYFDGDDDVYFYVNGHLVMDIGGAHPHCDDDIKLNDIADDIGLVDGGIYSFDMFYAERHTEAANLAFKTNIKIMDTMSLTSKEQYNTSNDTIIPYGSIVREGTTVAYNFGLLNMRSVPVYNISFYDESLGTSISKDDIKLYDSAKTNDAVTNITEVIVYYHTYDRPSPSEEGVLNKEIPKEKEIGDMQTLLDTAKNNNVSLETGSYKVSITSVQDLKTLLEIGIPIDTQICVYGIKRTVTNNDRPYTNTVTSKAVYSSNGKTVELHGVASQKLTVLNSFSASTDKEQIVIDYGKPVQIAISEITDNIHLNSNVKAKFYGITYNGYHNRIRTTVDNVVTALDSACDVDSSAGMLYLRGTESGVTAIEYQLKEMLKKVEKGYAVYEIEDAALSETPYAKYYLWVEVDIIPATNVYYETDFADGVFELETTGDKWEQPMDDGDPNERNTKLQDPHCKNSKEIYGYDSSYENDSCYSNGSSFSVIGQGVKPKYNTENDTEKKYTEARFSFTGTGFDLISRTGANEGSIRVDVYSDEARTNRVKTVTVLNKSESGLELYQIPVVSIEKLDYGTYYVTISVNAAYNNANVPALSRGASFYFDAVRIFNPIDVSAGVNATGDALIAYNAYCTDGEANASITEVRNNLISEGDFDMNSSTDGMAFVDGYRYKANDNAEEQIIQVANISTYKKVGPNNEVYLKKGTYTDENGVVRQTIEAIAFKIKVGTYPVSVDIGAKSADGESVTMKTKIAQNIDGSGTSIERTININTSTAQFYDLANNQEIAPVFNSKDETYVFISNTGNGILSITDIKLGYGQEFITSDVSYQVDSDVAKGAEKFLLSLLDTEDTDPEVVPSEYDIISVEFDRKTGYIFKDAALKVKTSQSVEQLKVTSYMRWVVYDDSSYVDTEDGYRMWTIRITPFVLDSQTYKVVGYGEDGTAGAPMSAALDVKWK